MIQLIFGRYFWALVVSFLALASYFTALSVNQIVRLSMAQFDVPEQAAPALGGDTLATKSMADKVLKGINLLDPNNGLVVPPPPSPDKRKATDKDKAEKKKPKQNEFGCPSLEPGQEIPESKMKRARLKGTSVADDPAESMAAMYVRVKELIPPRNAKEASRPPRHRMVWRVEFFRMGEMIMPNDKTRKAKLCAVGPREAILFRKGKLEKLVLDSKKQRKRLYYGAFGMTPGKEGSKGPGEVKVREGDKYSISRATVNSWLANPMQHAMSARIMPHYENGQSAGLRLVWVRKKSLYSQIGLKSGDVVRSVNGKTLNVSNALGLYSQLPHAKAIRVNIIRKGVRRTILYNVK